jgi:hypothetical protein
MEKTLQISNDYSVTLEELIGESVFVVGMKGSGKTNTAAVILEELLKNKYPMSIIDIEGEYWGLKEKFEILHVGKSENVDIEIDIEHAEQIAEISMNNYIPIIIDLSDFEENEIMEFMLIYLKRIWELSGKFRKPYGIVIEEAQEFIPQGTNSALKDVIKRIAKRGRKRGLGSIIISQRSQAVDKEVITQSKIMFLHNVTHPTDMKVYQQIVPLEPKEVKNMVDRLNTGQCIFRYGKVTEVIQIRQQETFHAGFTPTMEGVKTPNLKSINEDLLNIVKKMTKSKRNEHDKKDRLEKKIERLEGELADRDSSIMKMQDDIRLLSQLKIKVDWPSTLEVINLNVGNMGNVKGGQVISKKETTAKSMLKDENYAATSVEYMPNYIKVQLKVLLDKIKKLPRKHKEMLKFLIWKYPQSYDVASIAMWINYSETTLTNNPPRQLIDMKVITRTRVSQGYLYMSNIEKLVRDSFEIHFKKDRDDWLNLIVDYVKLEIDNM